MQKLKELLNKSFQDIDFDNEKNLVSDGVFDSLSILNIIEIIKENYNVKISVNDLIASNFESLESIYSMINNGSSCISVGKF